MVEPDSQGRREAALWTRAVASSVASVTSASQTETAGVLEPHKAKESTEDRVRLADVAKC